MTLYERYLELCCYINCPIKILLCSNLFLTRCVFLRKISGPLAVSGQVSTRPAYTNCKYCPICPLLIGVKETAMVSSAKLNFAIKQSLLRLLVMKSEMLLKTNLTQIYRNTGIIKY